MAVVAVLASLCACGQSGAGPMSAAAGTETIVLSRADQPTVHRPTLERLKREAASSGRPLEELVKRYATRVAATSSPRRTDFEGYDPAVTDPGVTIDGIPYAELVDLGVIAESEGISYAEAIDRFGSQSSNSRVIDQLNAEFPDEISGVGYVDDQRGLRVGFKGPIPARAIELARTLPLEVTLIGGKGFSTAELRRAPDRGEPGVLAEGLSRLWSRCVTTRGGPAGSARPSSCPAGIRRRRTAPRTRRGR
ncbi:hypothetical protein [Microbispora bryophytorum]|uniref:hypothetical protein n=1 Tax=Microbispora bryophytorum TaxID=1460882 RepID=UPI0033DF428A